MSDLTSSVETLFRGRIITLGVETVCLPDGRTFALEIVRHPGGAAVVALDERRRVCLVRQYRHAANGWIWELPAGKIDAAEAPERTAHRELREEAGVRAAHWLPLGCMHSSPGVFDEVIHLYLARDLSLREQQLDADEMLEVHWIDWDQALSWAIDGSITDAKTLVGLFRAHNMMTNEA
jgi:8-oxo-dGTP pyrophosphatase MutT (NUDIX family)